MDEVRAYTIMELTEILKVTRRTIYNYIKGAKNDRQTISNLSER
jgi:transcriptional antiterminator